MESKAQYRVYIEDTDLLQVVYHARYLHFFERARTDCLRQLGVSYLQLQNDNYHLAVSDLSIQYKKPARLDDNLIIKTHYQQTRTTMICFEQSMYNETGVYLAHATVNVVILNSQFKPTRLSDEWRSILKLKNGD